MMNRNTNLPMWNVGYAILPSERRKGNASASLNALSHYLLQNYSFPHVMFDICTEDHDSEGVVKIIITFREKDSQQWESDLNHVIQTFKWDTLR